MNNLRFNNNQTIFRKKFLRYGFIFTCIIFLFYMYPFSFKPIGRIENLSYLDQPLEGEQIYTLPHQYIREVWPTIFFLIVPPNDATRDEMQRIKRENILKPSIIFNENFNDWFLLNSSFVIITSSETALKYPLDLQEFRRNFLEGTKLWKPPYVYNEGMVFLSKIHESSYAFNKTHSKKGWRIVLDIPHLKNQNIGNHFDITRTEDISIPSYPEDCENPENCCLPKTFKSKIPFWIGFKQDLKEFVNAENPNDHIPDQDIFHFSKIERLNILIEREKEYKVCQYYSRFMSNYAWYGISQILHLHHIYTDREGPPKRERPSKKN